MYEFEKMHEFKKCMNLKKHEFKKCMNLKKRRNFRKFVILKNS